MSVFVNFTKVVGQFLYICRIIKSHDPLMIHSWFATTPGEEHLAGTQIGNGFGGGTAPGGGKCGGN